MQPVIRSLLFLLFSTLVLCGKLEAQPYTYLAQAEYYFDTDPGNGNGTALNALDGNFNNAIETVVASASISLSTGTHILGVRVKGTDGNWGTTYKTVLSVVSSYSDSISVQSGEYYFDTDPGNGNATTMLAFDGNFNSALESVISSPTSPSTGTHLLGIRIRDIKGNWGPTFQTVISVINSFTDSVSVQAGEYYFDTDPGNGNATTMLAFDGNFNNALESVIASPTAPSNGTHILGIRIRDVKGNWGATFKTVLSVVNTYADSISVQAGEYYFDTDPGNGNATTMLAFDGNFNNALESVIASPSAPSNGTHLLGIRLRDIKGNWGATFQTVLSVVNNYSDSISVQAGEFYFDTDPGNGNATTMLAFDGNFNNALESVIASPSAPSNGTHLLGIRLRDIKGNWGSTFKTVLSVVNNYSDSISVQAGEYYFDTDPGNGNATAMLAFDGNFNNALESVIASPSTPSNGTHLLGVRLRDIKGNWGATFKTILQVTGTTSADIKIQSGEYFFDSDPGNGNGITILAFDGNYNDAIEKASGLISTGSLSIGAHTFNVRFKDQQNNWGSKYSIVIDISTCIYTTPNITLTPNGNQTLCAGDSILLTASSTNTGLTYHWRKNGIIITGASDSLYYATQNGDYDVVVTNSNGCSSISSVANVQNGPGQNTPTVAITASDSSFCSGTGITISASSTFGGNNPIYTFKKNSITVQNGSSPTYFTNSLANNDTIICILTSDASCVSTSTANSGAIVFSVQQAVTPSVTISASSTQICSGGSVTFTATPTNGGQPVYQWYINSLQVGTNNGTFTTSTLSNNDSVRVRLISNASCRTQDTVYSTFLQMQVNPIITPSVTISASIDSFCSGTSVAITASPINGGLAHYQWFINNTLSGTDTSIFVTTGLNSGDSVRVRMISNATCRSIDTVYSSYKRFMVYPLLVPGISISSTDTTLCPGSSAIFSASVTNGGNNPVLTWKKNGNTVGTNSTNYTDSFPSQNDSYVCELVSNATCLTNSGSISSNPVVIQINPVPQPVITVTGSTTLCNNTSAILSVASISGSTYQWFNASAPISGATTNQYTASAAGSFTITQTSSQGCLGTSSSVTTQVVNCQPSISSVNSLQLCQLASITVGYSVQGVFTGNNTFSLELSSSTGSFASPTLLGSISSTSNSGTITATIPGNLSGTGFRVRVSASNPSQTGVDNGSNITIFQRPTLSQVTATISPDTITCVGNLITLTVPTNNTLSFQWQRNTTNITGATSNTYQASQGGTYRVVATNSNGCSRNGVGRNLDFVNPISASITPNTTQVLCTNTTIVLSSNTDPTVIGYQWYRDNNPISGATQQTYTAGISGNYTVKLTQNSNCEAVSPAVTVDVVNCQPQITGFTGTQFCQVQTVNVGYTVLGVFDPSNIFRVELSNSTGSFASPTVIGSLTTNANSGSIPSTFPGNVTGTGFRIRITSTNSVQTGPDNGANLTLFQRPTLAQVTPVIAPDTFACVGNLITLTAPTNNTLTFQWQKNSTNISGATSNAFQASSSGNYRVIATNTNGCSRNGVARTLNFTTAIAATISPNTTQIVCPNTAVVFTANYDPSVIGYQWYFNNSPISGATQQTYTSYSAGDYMVRLDLPAGCQSFSNAVSVQNYNCSLLLSGIPNPLCQGQTTNLSFTSQGSYSNGNIYTVQLSNALGSFTNALSIGTLSSTSNAGTISITIPSSVAQGTGYRMRLLSSNPAQTGQDNGSNLTINSRPGTTSTVVSANPATTGCTGDTITVSVPNSGSLTYQWQRNNSNVSGATQYFYKASIAGTYRMIATNTNGCSRAGTGLALTFSNCVRSSGPVAQLPGAKLWPNPSNSESSVTLYNIEEDIHWSVEITDMLGKIVGTANSKGGEMITFGQGLSKGVYQVTITTSNGKTFVERWVKQ